MILNGCQADINGLAKMFKDCVGRVVSPRFELNAKNFIQYQGQDISDTRMMNSVFTCINPRYEILNDVLFLPYAENYHIPSSGFFEHWAYDENLNPIAIANHYKPVLRGYKDHHLLPKYPFSNFNCETLNGYFYYMGMLNLHYGHFIQESLTRFWLALEKPNLVGGNTKFVFHVMKNFNHNDKMKLFNSNLKQFLTALGLNENNILLIQKPIVLENVIVPESSIGISDGNCYLSDNAKSVWNYLNEKMSTVGYESINNVSNKIYLSRKKVKNPIQGRVLVNESELESSLVELGFDIICPEDYDQNQMQAILNQTKVIVGAPGSGLQNSFFIPKPAKTIGISTKAIIRINPGLNHQIHTDIICGHKTNAIVAEHDVDKTQMRWSLDLKSSLEFIENII